MCAGFYDRTRQDLCWRDYISGVDMQIQNYTLNPLAAMRENTSAPKISSLSFGTTPSFYGPLAGSKVTQDSYITGRARVESKCGECQTVRLPDDLFPTDKESDSGPCCYSTIMQPIYSRQPKSCFSASETITYPWTLFPEANQKNFAGVDAVVDTNLQTRFGWANEDAKYDVPSNPCGRTNYGNYQSNQSYKPYSF